MLTEFRLPALGADMDAGTIVEWHVAEQYLIAQNAPDDPTAPGRWTRIDWVELDGMPPFRWGFCLTEYQAPSRDAARATPPASRGQ